MRFADTFDHLVGVHHRIHIIGGGPSLKDPPHHIEHGLSEFTIGINVAALHFPCDISFVKDERVMRLLDERLPKSNTTAVVYVERTSRQQYPDWHAVSEGKGWPMDMESVAIGDSTAVSAINIADQLGAKEIYLEGFDFSGTDGHTDQYHDDYPEEWRQSDDVYDKFEREITEAARKCAGRVYRNHRIGFP